MPNSFQSQSWYDKEFSKKEAQGSICATDFLTEQKPVCLVSFKGYT